MTEQNLRRPASDGDGDRVADGDPNESGGPPASILLVTEAGEGMGGASYPGDMNVAVIPYDNLDSEAIDGLNPDVVITAIVSSSFDCMDVAGKLTEAEFSGQMNVLSRSLPRPELVLRELRSTYPTIEVDLITTLPGGQGVVPPDPDGQSEEG